jgi:mono/diheme cytochrome c family protein
MASKKISGGPAPEHGRPLMNDRVQGNLRAAFAVVLLALYGCGGGGGGGGGDNGGNAAPSANAGADQSAIEGDDVQVTGSGNDSDGSVASFSWTQTSGPAVTLAGANTATVSFATPTVMSDQSVVLQLNVTDNGGASDTDTVTIRVANDDPPEAVGGDDITVTEEETFSLDGSASSDDVEITVASWSPLNNTVPLTEIPGANQLQTQFVAPEVSQTTQIEFQLEISDRQGQTVEDRVIVTVRPNPPDIDRFLTFLNKDSPRYVESLDTGAAYYKAVDPNNQKTTLADWKTANGFDNGFDARAVYRNAADLGFGRGMFMRTNSNGNVAAYVENYPTLADAVAAVKAGNNNKIIATVCMEWSPPPGGGARYVKFYTFRADGKRVNPDETVFAPDLDGRGEKFQPGVCNICHGGQPKPLVGNDYPDNGNTDAQFLPWDVDSFEFSDDPEFTRAALEPQFKKLNQGALSTYPANGTAPSGTWDPATARELVEGWYGGTGLPSATFIGSFTPSGWLNTAQVPDAETIYHDVVARNCRACHVQRGTTLHSQIAFRSYDDFNAYRERIKTLVYDRGTMPDARLTFDNFWRKFQNKDSAAILAQHLGIDHTTRHPGRPVADPGPGRLAGLDPSVVQLNGSASLFASTYKWSFRDEPLNKPAGSGTVIFSDTSPNASLFVDLIGLYKLQLVVSDGENDSPPAPIDVLAFNGLTTPTFNDPGANGIANIINGSCGTLCHKAAGGTPGIPVRFDNLSTIYSEVRKYVNLEQPAASPILMKPSYTVPHGGGLVTGFDAPTQLNKYDTVLRWIMDGAKNN